MRTNPNYDLLLATVCLFLGTMTYLLYRPTILMLDHHFFQSFQLNTGRGTYQLLFANYFPDLCWSLFVNISAWWMWRRPYPRFYIYFLLALPFASEWMQWFAFIPGTFDAYDLLIYLISFSVFYIIYNKPK